MSEEGLKKRVEVLEKQNEVIRHLNEMKLLNERCDGLEKRVEVLEAELKDLRGDHDLHEHGWCVREFEAVKKDIADLKAKFSKHNEFTARTEKKNYILTGVVADVIKQVIYYRNKLRSHYHKYNNGLDILWYEDEALEKLKDRLNSGSQEKEAKDPCQHKNCTTSRNKYDSWIVCKDCKECFPLTLENREKYFKKEPQPDPHLQYKMIEIACKEFELVKKSEVVKDLKKLPKYTKTVEYSCIEYTNWSNIEKLIEKYTDKEAEEKND